MNSIIDSAREQEVPLVFALNRKRLAAILKKKFNVGCIGLISYAGAEVSEKVDVLFTLHAHIAHACNEIG